MKFSLKNASISLMIYCIAFCLYREWQVYQHYVVINRSYFPVMSEFYKMYATYFCDAVVNLSAAYLGYRVASSIKFFQEKA